MTAEQRAGLSDAALAMTQPCIDELIKDISKRVQKAGAITDTAEYQIYRAQALGEGKKAIEQAVSKQIGISEEVIASLFEYVADKSLSPDENGSLKRMTEAYTRMTQSKTRELLRDLWADTPEGKKRIFGWDTEATGAEYVAFMREYLPAVLNVLRAQGVDQNCLFHISDEPNGEQLAGYLAAKEVVKPYL